MSVETKFINEINPENPLQGKFGLLIYKLIVQPDIKFDIPKDKLVIPPFLSKNASNLLLNILRHKCVCLHEINTRFSYNNTRHKYREISDFYTHPFFENVDWFSLYIDIYANEQSNISTNIKV